MNDAAARAIRYMETPHRKVLVDYNYAELQQVEKTNARLQLQRFRKKEIEEQKIKIRELVGCCFRNRSMALWPPGATLNFVKERTGIRVVTGQENQSERKATLLSTGSKKEALPVVTGRQA